MQQISFDGCFPVPGVVNLGGACAQDGMEELFFVLPSWGSGNATLTVSFPSRQGLMLPIVNGTVMLTCAMTGQQGRGRGVVQMVSAGHTVWQSGPITFNIDWTGATPPVTPQENYLERLAVEVQQNAERAEASAQSAQEAVSTANGYATQAQQSAYQAQVSAENASQEASRAAQEAVEGLLDDTSVVHDKTWSSAGIVERLTVPFTVHGNPVQCYPVEGTQMTVTASAGDVTVYGKNLADISETGWLVNGTTPLASSATISAVFGENSIEVTNKTGTTATGGYRYIRKVLSLPVDKLRGRSVTFSVKSAEMTGVTKWEVTCRFYAENSSTAVRTLQLNSANMTRTSTVPNTAGSVAILAYSLQGEIVEAGSGVKYTGIQLELGNTATNDEPYQSKAYTAQEGTPLSIPALSGQNNVVSAVGDMTVTGHEDPRHTIQALAERISVLEANATNL